MANELRFSLVVPIYNEQETVGMLLDEIAQVLMPMGAFEVVLVDDGSRDRSVQVLLEWKSAHAASWLRIVRLRANVGQSGAVMAGVEAARAPFIATMDGDLQNDPRDLAPMLHRLESEPCDAVVGVRRHRRDPFVRRLSSRVGNSARNWLTGDRATDAACGIKVVRREVFLRVPRFVGMHRFMATLVRFVGGRVVEMDVNHRPRAAGQAKYGIGNRVWRGLRDCLAVGWLRTRVLQHGIQEEL
jgi:dolichol-phosphate mannosyltransferase